MWTKKNLSMKQGSLFCFVLSCWDLPTHGTSCGVGGGELCISSESSRWARVHWLGLRLFGASVWKLSINEPFLLLEIQKKIGKNNWVRKEKINWALNVFTLGPNATGYTKVSITRKKKNCLDRTYRLVRLSIKLSIKNPIIDK
jgi:hypothetical protein